MSAFDRVLEKRTWPCAVIAAALAAVVCAAASRTLLNHAPTYDELLHVLAARSLIHQGVPKIADGVYNRAEIFTRLVALSMRHFGETPVAARLPGWLAALLLAACVGAWTTRKVGWLAGILAGLLLATSVRTLEMSVFARFYTLHALLVFLVFICLYEVLAQEGRALRQGARMLYLAGAAAALAVAWHLQVLTAVALGAIAAGFLMCGAMGRRRSVIGFIRAHPVSLAAGTVILLAVGIFALRQLGFIELYTGSALWAARGSLQINYYNRAAGSDWPLLWPLAVFAVLALYGRHPRLAMTLGVIFAAGFLVQSLAAQKAARYFYYGESFLCILTGSGAAVSLQALGQWLEGDLRYSSRTAALLVLAPLAFLVAASHEGQRTARLLLGKAPATRILSYGDEPDWTYLMPVLAPLARSADVVLTSNSMKALYYLGRYDFEINASIVEDTDTAADFGVDWHTGRHVVSRPESIARIVDGARRALIIVEEKKLGVKRGVPQETVSAIDARCQRLPAAASGITLWTCPRSAPAPAPGGIR